jgi:apolipoprotein N-acyltransferase
VKALLQSLPVLLALKIRIMTKGKLWHLALITAWIAWEYVDLNWFLSWSWLVLGNALGFAHFAVQWYEYTGVLGGSLWILLVNLFFYDAFFNSKAKFVGATFFLLMPALASTAAYFLFEPEGEKIEVVVVQPNLDCYEEKFEINPANGKPSVNYVPVEEQISRFLTLSAEKLTPETRFLLFPETALHQDFDERDTGNSMLRTILDFLQKYKKLSLISGADTYKFYKPEEASKTARISSDGSYAYDYFNTALFADENGNFDFYHKSKLVIGAETNPFQTAIPTFGPLIFKDLTVSLGEDTERKAFKNSEGKALAPVICYESIFGEFVTEYIKKGAQGIAVITNDGWWGNTPGHRQHLAHSRLRAVETRKDVFRAANTGISCYVNARGDIGEKLAYGEKGALRLEGYLNKRETFYVRFGDYLGRLSLFLIFFLSVSAFVLKMREKR